MKDSKGRPVVAVTGTGIVTALGQGKKDNWDALTSGRSGIHSITRFPTEGLRTTIGGTIDFVDVDPFNCSELTTEIAHRATSEAVKESGIGSPGDFPGPLFMAMPPIEMEWPLREKLLAIAGVKDKADYADLIRASAQASEVDRIDCLFGSVGERLAEIFGTKGSPISLTTACASGTTGIQLAIEAIRRGETEAALAVAADGSMNPETMIRFSLLSALSTQNDNPEKASRPFSKNRDGFVMAEGAAALVIESYEHAKARGANILGIVAGGGEKADSFHRTRSNPDGKAILGAMQAALADAGVTPDQIDYINAHGTGTPENDKMEHFAVNTIFGERARNLPISSNKSMIGHTLTAAGAIEAVVSLQTLEHQRLPPTINYDVPDPAIELDVVPNTARDAKVNMVMSNSFGFGGQNASLIFSTEPA
ncbi:beta-ketoacyl-ACP synthase [Tepidamorphus sp. 3E244]|uniref:beta-ketoacyl-ACP synthase n=1 Tax=Tepidamorphus sp. 3E244 TaxID=3385498 RepID=UPI0038FC8D45